MPPVPRELEGQAETIGQRLRRLRHERGLSQRELSSPGVSYAYISRIEAGARRPSVKALRMLAKKLGVSADYLETGSEIRDTDERELRIADAELELRLADQPGEAEQKLEALRDAAVAAGDVVAASRANIALGLAAAAAGRNADAIERLEAGLELSPVSPSGRPDVFATLGRAYAATGRPDRAVEVFERCLAEVSEDAPEDLTAQVRFTTYLSYALTDLGDLERAQDVLDTALDQADAMTDAYSRVRLYWSLARLADLQGRPAAALDYVRRAIALLDVTDDTLHLARAHLLCGSILLSQGRAGGCRPSLRPGRGALRVASRARRHREPLHRPGTASRAPGRRRRGHPPGTSRARCRRRRVSARERKRPLGARRGPRAHGDTDGAHESFRNATTLLEEQGHRRDYVEAYRAWGKFLRRSGREDEALEVLERAADLAAEPVAADHRGKR